MTMWKKICIQIRMQNLILMSQDFTITADYTDYRYDYDNCYDSNFEASNDCKQDGEKYNFAVNNEYFTLGRTHDKANYTTGDWLSYYNESSTDYLRVGDPSGSIQQTASKLWC